MYGISKRAYPELDIKKLTLKKAKEIYKRDYWNTCGATKVSSYRLKVLMFSVKVNGGKPQFMLQESLNFLNKNQLLFDDLTVDGIIGRKTMRALSRVSKNDVAKVFIALWIERYLKITKKREKNESFIVGWINRATSFLV